MAESFYIDRLANAGVEIPVAGRIVRVYQFTMGDHGCLQSIIRRLQPHPMAEAKEMAAGIELQEIAAEILRDGYRYEKQWPAPLDSEEGIRILMNDVDGRRAIVNHFADVVADCSRWRIGYTFMHDDAAVIPVADCSRWRIGYTSSDAP